jgi:hypothetical protein
MTEYTDVPKANALHLESQQVAQAITILEAGGSLASMTISPPPPVMPEPGEPIPPMMMSVYVTVPPPTDPALSAELITWLNKRLVEIAGELTTLGVTVPPAGSAVWSTPPTPMLPTPPMPMTTTPMMQPPAATVNPNPHSGE